jgi:peroxiredoxin
MLAILLLAALMPAAGLQGAPPQFALRDTQGIAHTEAEWDGSKAIVLFFVTNDCPVANSYVAEMNRIHDSWVSKGVRFYAVQADTSVPEAIVAHYAKDYRYGFPVLLDPQQVLVRRAGATVISQAAVLTPQGKLLYRGRVDNRVEDFGKQRREATVHDLRDALDAILAGKTPPNPFTRAIGCAIPPAEGRKS